MKKTVLVFGLISGVISAGMMLVTMPFTEHIGYDRALVVGYTNIVLSFLLVYFGIRSYRDNLGGGEINFARAFGVGILITLISCAIYVVSWEIVYFGFKHVSMDHYYAHMIDKVRASGASDAVIAAKVQEINHTRRMYENPLINSLMTFIEPFPVGLVITLLSAAILRKKKPDQQTVHSPVAAA
jgi:peptidoglycan biosynthesis protein MviN/MurJ (putative lipid II flippase)